MFRASLFVVASDLAVFEIGSRRYVDGHARPESARHGAPLVSRTDFGPLQTTRLGIGGTGPVVGLLDKSVRLRHLHSTPASIAKPVQGNLPVGAATKDVARVPKG